MHRILSVWTIKSTKHIMNQQRQMIPQIKAVVLTCGSCNMMGSLGEESLVLFFLFLRLVLGVVATLARFFPKAVVKVVEVAEIPMVVVVVALGGSIGTSVSGREGKI